MDRKRIRNAYLLIAVQGGVIVGLVTAIVLRAGGKPTLDACVTGMMAFLGTTGLAIAIMGACGMFATTPNEKD